jgi:Domain of unknown function (DUF1841)
MFVKDRDDARRYFIKVWRKYNNKQPLEALEQLILDVILAHPEYHGLLDQGEKSLRKDYSPEVGGINPFLHMSMHIAIKEQIETDRPAGIRALCEALLDKGSDLHKMEHKIMECLGESLWLAQRNNSMPNELAYLESVRALK